mmetsp:Transcript_8245/g.18443  ORF Transcript_8245/g.18443 Transcript_8245/m.18443 type:complete len:227 (-) Transcript_8245:148-828(-)
MGKGGGGKKGGKGGKGFFQGTGGGGAPGERMMPVMEEPPLYPKEKFPLLERQKGLMTPAEIRLITCNRRAVVHWHDSPCRVVSAPTGVPGYLRESYEQSALDTQMKRITGLDKATRGIKPSYFPTELLLRTQHKVKRRGAARGSGVDALRKIEAKEAGSNPDKKPATQPASGENEKPKAVDPDAEDAEEDEGDFGGDDYGLEHDDVEDGMGSDFDEKGGGGGDDEY